VLRLLSLGTRWTGSRVRTENIGGARHASRVLPRSRKRRCANLLLAEFPHNLVDHAEQNFGVHFAETQPAHETAEFFLCKGFGARMDVAALVQGLEERLGEPLDRDRSCGRRLHLWRARRPRAGELVEAHGHGLAKIHRAMLWPRGNMQQPMAVAKGIVREAPFFAAKEQRNRLRSKTLANERRSRGKHIDGMLRLAIADSGRADNKRAIGDSPGDIREFLGLTQEVGSADGGLRFAKSDFVGIYHAETRKAKVAHGPRRRADVEGIAGAHEDDAEIFERKHGRAFYAK